MKKIILSLIISTCFFLYSFGQTANTSKLSFGLDAGVPVGQAANIYSSVFGVSAKLELPVPSSSFNVTITSGFSDFMVKNAYTDIIGNATYVPIEVGGKFYFGNVAYFEGNLGASVNVNSNYSASKAAFMYAPALGFTLPDANAKSAVDIGIRYEGRVETGGTLSQVALRVAYRFGL